MGRRDVEYVMSLRDRFSSRLDRINAKAFQLDNRMRQLNKTTKRLSVAGRGLSLFLAGAVVANVVKTAAKFEGLDNAISFASGSAEQASKNLKFLDDISTRLGLNIQSTKEGFQTLAGSFVGTGVSAEQQRKIFNQTATAVSALNLNAEDSKGVFLALGQIMSKGKVTSEELRRQLGNRLPGAVGIAARSMGLALPVFEKMMADGLIPATKFLPLFAAELDKTFRGALGKSTVSLQANINRLTNVFLKLKQTAGQELSPGIKKLAGTTDFLLANIKPLIKFTKIAIKTFIFFKATTFLLTTGLRIYVIAVKLTTVAHRFFTKGAKNAARSARLLGLAVKASPIGIFTTIVTGAILALQLFGDETDKGTDKLTRFGNKLDEINAKIGKNLFQRIVRGLVDPITKTFDPGKLETLTKALPNFAKSELESLKLFLGEQEEALSRQIENAETLVTKSILIDDLNQIRGAMKLLNIEFTKFGKGGAGGIAGGNLTQTGGITKIVSAAPKIFNINIEKLVETINNNVTNLPQAMAQTKKIVTEAMLAALNDTQTLVR